MTTVYFDRKIDDDSRRERLYAGDLFVYSPTPASLALVGLARGLLAEAFKGKDPRLAQHDHEVADYARILAEVKPRFIHHPECKKLVPEMLSQLGCDPQQTYFDIPRMRSSTSHGYLTTGIAYAFHPHRDTWYSAPMCQINWWLPIFEIESGNAMAFHPQFFDRKVSSNSWVYNYQDWNARHRFAAAQQIGKDSREQPKPQEDIPAEPRLVVVAPVGGVLAFSAAHLHSSIPNNTGLTRFSIDFRTVHRADASKLGGARNIDNYCTGSTMDDHLCCANLSRLPEPVQQAYRQGHPQAVEFPAG